MSQAAPREQRLWIPVSGNLLLCEASGSWRPLTSDELTRLGLPILQEHSLEHHGKQEIMVVDLGYRFSAKEVIEDTAGTPYLWLGLRSQLGLIDEALFGLAGRALQVAQWHNDHRFCGRCGGPTKELRGERAKMCPACDLRFYPRLSPCVITLITREDQCLLARHARSSQPIFTCLAGFVEVGETPEATVHREVYEEVGLQLCDLRYVGSQPWPFPGQLMLGFRAQYLSGDLRVDGEEILEADWFPADKLPQVPPIATLSGQMIANFVRQHSCGRSELP